jgi:hypothetical protein
MFATSAARRNARGGEWRSPYSSDDRAAEEIVGLDEVPDFGRQVGALVGDFQSFDDLAELFATVRREKKACSSRLSWWWHRLRQQLFPVGLPLNNSPSKPTVPWFSSFRDFSVSEISGVIFDSQCQQRRSQTLAAEVRAAVQLSARRSARQRS